jgi:hypothetical protein
MLLLVCATYPVRISVLNTVRKRPRKFRLILIQLQILWMSEWNGGNGFWMLVDAQASVEKLENEELCRVVKCWLGNVVRHGK